MKKAYLTVLAALGCAWGRPAAAAFFNDVLPGARPMGMGMAYTAVSDDPYGMFFNPAGLAGSDWPELSGSVGRMISPLGLLSHETAVYTRPLPELPGSTVGAAFYSERQNNGGDKDELLLHFSDSLHVPQLHLVKPLAVGGNVKFVNVSPPGRGARFGLGFDGGAIFDSGQGLKAGLSITDLVTPVGVPDPSLNLGGSYLYGDWALLAMDIRVRSGLTQVFPGVELEFFEKLLKVRFGKGLPLDGVGQAAFGMGFNLSPLVVDFGMAVPISGINRPGGAYQLTLSYKFGAPAFYGRFVGTAARQAEDLRSQLADMEARRKKLADELSVRESDKAGLEGQKQALEERVQELQRQTRELEMKEEREAYDVAHSTAAPRARKAPPPKAKTPKPRTEKKEPKKAPRSFPARHKVVPGDTLRELARTYYGDASLWEQIYEANPDKVERGLPVEGAVLTIPAPRR